MNNSGEEALNVSNNILSQCSPSERSPALEWLKTVVYLLIVVLAVFGNAFVIRTVYTRSRMKSATNYLIVNMAVGDLFMAIFNMIPTIVSLFRGNHAWVIGGPFGKISCKMVFFSQATSMACSIITLSVLAFERYFAIISPLSKVASTARTRWLVAATWVASFASASPMLYAAKVQLYAGVPYCSEDWAPAFDPKKAPAIYTIVAFVLLYAIPLLVIFILYSIIIVTVWERHIPGNTTSANVRLHTKAKKNVLKMLITVVVAFALCWFPIHLNLFLKDFTDLFPDPCGIPTWLQTTGFLFGHANSAINCCIYVIFSQDFRNGFKDFVRHLFPKRSRSFLPKSARSRGTFETGRGAYKGRQKPTSFKTFEEASV